MIEWTLDITYVISMFFLWLAAVVAILIVSCHILSYIGCFVYAVVQVMIVERFRAWRQR